MIEFVRGNLFAADVDALVNTVNTVGVMGKGIALQFSKEFPEIVKPYKAACESRELTVGKVFTTALSILEGPKYVINFPTKKHWKGKSKIEYIEQGLQALVDEILRLEIKSIAIPPFGCGLGGLHWPDVRSRIELAFSELDDVEVFVYEPSGTPKASEMKNRRNKPKMSPGRATLITLMKRYLTPILDDTVTLLEVHKLMYFAKEGGGIENLDKLDFTKGHYGPYSPNLRYVLIEIEGHYVTGFGDGSEEPGKNLELMPEALKEAEQFLKTHPVTRNALERVESLIDGFETAYGMELLASVHWVAKHDKPSAQTSEESIRLVHDWNSRKRDTFAAEHIRVAWDRLAQSGWINE